MSAAVREARALTRGEHLMAELEQLRAWRKAPKRVNAAKLAKYRAEAQRIRVDAERILAGLPVEHPRVIVERRAALVAGDGDVRGLAESMLADLPPDPDAGQHRADLLAATAPGAPESAAWRAGPEMSRLRRLP